jgi:hypothetical protein
MKLEKSDRASFFDYTNPLTCFGAGLALAVAYVLMLWPQERSILDYQMSMRDLLMLFLFHAFLSLQPALLFALRSSQWLKIPALLLFVYVVYLIYPGLQVTMGQAHIQSGQHVANLYYIGLLYWAYCVLAVLANFAIIATYFANRAPSNKSP